MRRLLFNAIYWWTYPLQMFYWHVIHPDLVKYAEARKREELRKDRETYEYHQRLRREHGDVDLDSRVYVSNASASREVKWVVLDGEVEVGWVDELGKPPDQSNVRVLTSEQKGKVQ